MLPQLANTDQLLLGNTFSPDEQGRKRSERLQPGALVGQGGQAHPWQRLTEDTWDVLEIDEVQDIGRHSPAGVFTEPENLDRDTGCCDVLERFAERLAVGGRDHDSGEALAVPERDVLEPVRIDTAVFIDLRNRTSGVKGKSG